MYNRSLADASLIGCPHCDLLQRLPKLDPGESARCPRCNKELWRRQVDPFGRPLALTIAAALLYVVANTVPMLGLTVLGRENFTTVFGGTAHLWHAGWHSVAILVLFTAVVAPGLQIGMMLAILIGARFERPRRWVGALLRYYPKISTWSMIEVMIFLIAAIEASFDPRVVWERVEWVENAERVKDSKQLTEVTS